MSFNLTSQNYELKISSTHKKEAMLLGKLHYIKKHSDSTLIKHELLAISEHLKTLGYFTNTIDSISKFKAIYTAHFTLNEKIEKAILRVADNKFLANNLKIENNYFSIPIEKLQPTLLMLSLKLDESGASFSKIQLKNIQIKNKILFAVLHITQSEKRYIDKVIVKGYEAFPKTFLKHYFNIKKNTPFSQKKITTITNASKSLNFINEVKSPEVLFKKDSTFLYLYLKKHKNSSFDGLVNFTSKKNGAAVFTGYLDLKLNNILNSGESFKFVWNRMNENRQELKLTTEIPYLFNSKLSPQISFSIYQQDSSFINTQFDSKIFYAINSKVKLAFTYNAETSNNLIENSGNTIASFNNYFVGFQFQYRIPKNDFFNNKKFHVDINPTLGHRKTPTNSSSQFKIETSASYIWDFNDRNSLYVQNKIGHLNSDSYFQNELFRIGGANSIRGFNEQGVFTSSYTYFNLEYRYLTSAKSYLYTITDIGKAKTTFNTENLLGIGLGYLYINDQSIINIGIAVNRDVNNQFLVENSKIIIDWSLFF